MIGVDDVASLVTLLDAGGVRGRWQRRDAARRLASMRSPAAARALAKAYVSGRDERVVAIAADALADVQDPGSVDAVCDVVIATGDERLAALAAEAGHVPSGPERQALLLFLAGRFDEYDELDFDGGMLAAVRAAAHDGLRARLAERARAAGRLDLVRLADRGGALSDPEWDATIGILTAAGRWADLWRLTTQAPPRWAVHILRELRRQRWRPENESERVGFDELTALAEECPDDPADGVLMTASVLDEYAKEASSLVVSPDGETLACGGKNEVRLWWLPPAPSAGVSAGVLEYRGVVRDLVALPGNLLAGCGSEMVQLWDLEGGGSTGTTLHRRRVDAGVTKVSGINLAVAPDGRFMVTSGPPPAVWRPPWNEPADSFRVGGTSRVAAAADGEGGFVVGADIGGELWLLRPQLSKVSAYWYGHEGLIFDLAVTPDGGLLASCGHDGTVRLWRLPEGSPAGVLTGHEGPVARLAVTPDGGLLASAGRDGIRLWRLPSGDLAGVLTGHAEGVIRLAVTPDGGLLATGDRDGRVRLWHLPSGAPAGSLSGHVGTVTALVFGPTSTLLATAGEDETVRLWELCHPALRIPLCTPVRELDPDEAVHLPDVVRDDQDRAWAAMIAALVQWHHRHDIDLEPAAAPPPERADIELDGG